MNYIETLKDIEKNLGIIPGFMKALPEEVLIHEWPLFKRYGLEETVIPAKYRELMGLAVAANIKCQYCQLFHTDAAKMCGATEEELSETFFLASDTVRWSAMLHAQNYDFEKFKEEFRQMMEYLQKMTQK